MKKALLLIFMSFSAFLVKAQKYEDIKNKLVFNKYRESKKELDNAMANAKFSGKAEAYMLKTTVYAGLAMDSVTNKTPEAYQLTLDADAAFSKYREMEPAMSLLSDPIYKNGPLNLYNSWYTLGAKDYEAKKWGTAFEKFNKSLAISDLLIEKKVISTTLDTIVVYFAATSAELNKNNDMAAKIYTRLTDAKVKNDWAESAYRFLVRYYFGKKDMASFEKYKALGKEFYPKSDFFTYDKVDFAIGLEEKFDDKLKAIEGVLVTDPNNLKANENLWGLIYDTLNSNKAGAVLPTNASELEKKMIEAITKTALAKPTDENPYLYLGNHFINKKERINDARKAHADEMKAKTKPGTMASKEDIAKRDLLDKQYFEAMEAISDPYENAAKIFAAKTTLDIRQKQQYRNLAGYLAEIYELKKKKAKAKSPEQLRFEAAEKKWNAVYESIK